MSSRSRSPLHFGAWHASFVVASTLVVLVLRALATFDVRESSAVHDYFVLAQLVLFVGPLFAWLHVLPRLREEVRLPGLAHAAVVVHALAFVLSLVAVVMGGLEGATRGWTYVLSFDAARVSWSTALLLVAIAVSATASALASFASIASVSRRSDAAVVAMRARAAVELAATPVLVGSVLAFVADRSLQLGLFDAAHGGDPTTWLHLFWAGLHPLLATLALPLLGSVFEGRIGRVPRMCFYAAAAASMLGWGQHLFATGLSVKATVVFSGLSTLATWPMVVLVGFAAVEVGRRPSARAVAAWVIATWMVFGEIRSASAGLLGLLTPFWHRDGLDGGWVAVVSILLLGARHLDVGLRDTVAERITWCFVVGVVTLLFVRASGARPGVLSVGLVSAQSVALLAIVGSLTALVVHLLRERAERATS